MLGMTFIFFFIQLSTSTCREILHRLGGEHRQWERRLPPQRFCEIPVMFGFQRLEKKVSVEKLIQFSVVFFFIRSLIYLFATNF